MPYRSFVDSPLWKEASALADSVLDFSRGIEDFSLRNRMTGSAVKIPFLIGEATESGSIEEMNDRLKRVEDPVSELRSVLTESKEQGFAPGADYELIQEHCRHLLRKVQSEASGSRIETESLDEEEGLKVTKKPEPVPAQRAARIEIGPPETTSSVERVTGKAPKQ
ncbi:MAG: four helix bundle protein [Verrucomicrobiota bacterium]